MAKSVVQLVELWAAQELLAERPARWARKWQGEPAAPATRAEWVRRTAHFAPASLAGRVLPVAWAAGLERAEAVAAIGADCSGQEWSWTPETMRL